MTDEEKKVVAEMLGLIFCQGMILELVRQEPGQQNGCDGCAFNNHTPDVPPHCTAPQTVPLCGDKIFVERNLWSTKN